MSEIPELLKRIGASFKNFCAEIAELEQNKADHEKRLESLENWRFEQSIIADFRNVERKIEALPPIKQTEALNAFKKLYELLSIVDLET